jgi:tetratricopeptide (TPR) repeat protein
MSSEHAGQNPGHSSEPVQRLDGEISALGLRPALEQILASGIEVGILHVAAPNRSGALFIRTGAVKAAIAPASNLQGMPALKQVLAAGEGKFRFSTELPREPIRETLNIDIGSLLAWRNANVADQIPSLAEALSVLSANAYSTWPTGQEQRPTVAGPPPEQQAAAPSAPPQQAPSSADLFGLQEALAAYEEQKKQERQQTGEDQSDSARQYTLEQMQFQQGAIPTPAPASKSGEITQRYDISDLKAIATPETAAPGSAALGAAAGNMRATGEMNTTGERPRDRIQGDPRRISMPYQRVGGHDRPSGAHRMPGAPGAPGAPDPTAMRSTAELTLPTGETLKASKVRQLRHTLISVGIASVLLLTAVIATNKMLSETNSAQNYARGTKLLKDGYKDLAKKSFDKVLASDPKNIKALLARGTANIQLNDFPAAQRDFDAVLEIEKKNLDALNGKALCYLKMRDFNRAVSATEDLLMIAPRNIEALSTSAQALLELRRFKLAQDAADRIIAAKPDTGMAAAYSLRGDSFFGRQKFADARKDYSEALTLEPGNRANYAKRARTALQVDDFQGAVADTTQAIFGDQSNPELYMLRGQAYEKLNQPDKAVQDYDKAVGLKPGRDTYAARAHAHLSLKNYNRAAADLAEVLKDPKAPKVYRDELAMVQQKIKTMPVAKIDMDALIGKPEKAVVLKYEEMVPQGQALLESGRAADAVKILTMAVRAKPQDVWARRYLARAMAMAGMPQQAIDQFKQVQFTDRLGPKDRTAYAHALVDLKQPNEAISLLNGVVSEDPDYADARILLIECLLKRNDRANAVELCRVGLSRARTAKDQENFQKLYQVAVGWQGK